MTIDTTYSVDRKLKEELDRVAGILNITRSVLIGIVLKELIERKKMKAQSFLRVRYQERNQDSVLVPMHVYLSPADYELFNDLRRVFKMSVSFILAFACKMYLPVLKKTCEINITDNYTDCYIFIFNFNNTLPSFTVYWGYPGEKALLKH